MPTPTAYADDIRRWCASMSVKPQANVEMVKDYIDRRWSYLPRKKRADIFKASMKQKTE